MKCRSTRSVGLRIPGWAESAALLVNGRPVEGCAKPGTYAEIRRKWHPGDVIELDLPMPARLIEAHPLVEEVRNEVAVQRGPLVYCLESHDLPQGIRVHEVVLPTDVELVPRYDARLLDGVMAIEANVRARPAGDWDGKLYRPRSDEHERRLCVRFIPYYAWSNRGKSEMSVWLPVR